VASIQSRYDVRPWLNGALLPQSGILFPSPPLAIEDRFTRSWTTDYICDFGISLTVSPLASLNSDLWAEHSKPGRSPFMPGGRFFRHWNLFRRLWRFLLFCWILPISEELATFFLIEDSVEKITLVVLPHFDFFLVNGLSRRWVLCVDMGVSLIRWTPSRFLLINPQGRFPKRRWTAI